MDKVIEFRKFHRKKRLRNVLRLVTVISMTIGVGIFAYAVINTEMNRPLDIPPYIEAKL
ncbi:hypothetical protein J2S09_000758 [Bacillus fengqiuensis]|nr:hypothetical protein [Bacillus fengqiuensis]